MEGRGVPRLDFSRVGWRVKQGIQFHTKITEAIHREHGEVPEVFFVRSVMSEFDDACGYRAP
jgi:hypothetical protein